MKKIMILGAGIYQVPLIKTAKEWDYIRLLSAFLETIQDLL